MLFWSLQVQKLQLLTNGLDNLLKYKGSWQITLSKVVENIKTSKYIYLHAKLIFTVRKTMIGYRLAGKINHVFREVTNGYEIERRLNRFINLSSVESKKVILFNISVNIFPFH